MYENTEERAGTPADQYENSAASQPVNAQNRESEDMREYDPAQPHTHIDEYGHVYTHTHTREGGHIHNDEGGHAHTHTDEGGHTHAHSHEHGQGHSHTHGGHEHHHVHSPEEKKAVLNRLSRAIGHLESVKRMVERDEDCSEVLIQLSAVRNAINNTGKVIMKNHISHCMVEAIEQNDFEAVEALNHAIDHFIK